MAIPEPQKSSENKYLGNRMLVILEDQRSHTRKALIPKLYENKITMKRDEGP